ncbi:hypothetical protein NHX12_005714 [Muraenolepis orangiensis]|uniref:Uncharacterized protein n=1 Tax=Muraenolepis orangiensis TaxID=630683 RepID=A0A9Q0IC82_9TELE|nr:hypothetical protein NHX12_005714 [Muraenolepis orangiensis]
MVDNVKLSANALICVINQEVLLQIRSRALKAKDTPLLPTPLATQLEGGAGPRQATPPPELPPGRVEESKPADGRLFPGSIDEPPRWRSGANGSREEEQRCLCLEEQGDTAGVWPSKRRVSAFSRALKSK